MKQIKKEYEWVGTDCDIETSLFEYGIIICKNPHCDTIDEYYYIYKIDSDNFSTGYIQESEINNLMLEDNWLETSDVLSFTGVSLEEWINQPLIHKLSDLISYYGYENILGSEYYPNNKEWLKENYNLQDEYL